MRQKTAPPAPGLGHGIRPESLLHRLAACLGDMDEDEILLDGYEHG